MKFSKVLAEQAALFPGVLQAFFPYKTFKKAFKQPCSDTAVSAAQQKQAELLRMLSGELQRLNQLFMEREELLVISWQMLCEEVAHAMDSHHEQQQQQADFSQHAQGPCSSSSSGMDLDAPCPGSPSSSNSHAPAAGGVSWDHLHDLLQLLVNFHGDAVMLMNWSHINYSAIAKALKKFDKHHGFMLKPLIMQRVACQPFCSTAILTRLTHSAEATTEQLTAHLNAERLHRKVSAMEASGSAAKPAACAAVHATAADAAALRAEWDASHLAECAEMSRRAQAAINTWHDLAATASTPSTIVTAL